MESIPLVDGYECWVMVKEGHNLSFPEDVREFCKMIFRDEEVAMLHSRNFANNLSDYSKTSIQSIEIRHCGETIHTFETKEK